MFKQFETTYAFTTPSNMKVYILYKPEFKSQSMIIGVPFGGLHTTILNESGQPYPSGLAHFLEHKLFESESGDIMAQFASIGANVNAFTSYQETCYYFNTTSNFKQASELLLNLVSECTLTPASVEKEKGIILSEIAMYEAMVDQALVHAMYQGLYHTHPITYDIAGTKASVEATTPEQLREAFHHFYHPSMMHCVCVTHVEIETVKAWILAHPLAQRTTVPLQTKTIDTHEPRHVASKLIEKTMDIEESKGIYAIKLNAHTSDAMANVRMQFSLRFLLEAMFSELNPLYQQWIDEGIVNEFFDVDVDVASTYSYIAFVFEHEHCELVFDWIAHALVNLDMDEVTLNQLKRRYLGISLRSLNKPSTLSKHIIRYALNGLDFFDVLMMFQSMSMSDIAIAKEHISEALNHVTRVKIQPMAKFD